MAKLLARNVAWHGTELSVTCPALTPVLGDEILTNGGFEGTYSSGLAPNWGKSGSLFVPTEEGTIIHEGDKAQHITGGPGLLKAQNLDANAWYAASAYVNVAASTLTMGSWMEGLSQGVTDGYTQISTHSCVATAAQFAIATGATTLDAYVDDASVKKFTFSTLHHYLGARPKNCVIDFAPTLTETRSYVGVLVRYKDENNYIFVGLFGTEAQIIKVVGGVLSQVAANVITGYGFTNGDPLHVELNGTSVNLWYNGAVAVTGTVADGGLGNEIHGFSTHADNSVGVVTTGSLTDGSRVDVLFTHDDGYTSQYTYGFGYLYTVCGKPGTIYINTLNQFTTDQLDEMYTAGWDLGNHSDDSDELDGLTQEQVETKLSAMKDWLDTRGYTRASDHVAYPGGAYDENVLAAMTALSMKTGRTVKLSGFEPALTNAYLIGCRDYSKAQVEAMMAEAIICKQTIICMKHDMVSNNSTLIDYVIGAGCNVLSISQWYTKHFG